MPALTDFDVKRILREARAACERRDARDPGLPGLELRVGRRRVTWRLYYTDRRTHRKERVNLGQYPDVGLAEARRRAKAHQAEIEDPEVRASPARDKRQRAASATFRQLAERRLAATGDEALAETSRELYVGCLERYVHGQIGDLPAAEVTHADVASIVDTVAARGTLVTADKVRIAISSTFAYAVRHGLATQNPARGLARRSSGLARDRVPSDEELRLVLRGIEDGDLSGDMRMILRLVLLTGARSSEIRLAERGDVRWQGLSNFTGPVLLIPGDRLRKGRRVRGRTKGGRDHPIPLSRQAAEIVRRALDASGERDRLFDIAERQQVSRAMARTCARAGLAGDAAITPHDFRRAISTFLGDRGERPDVIDAILGHRPATLSGTTYNLSLLLPIISGALQAWADHVEGLGCSEPVFTPAG